MSLDDTAACPILNEEVMAAITSNIPDFEFTDHMRPGTIGETNLQPEIPRGLVVIDYNIARVLASSKPRAAERSLHWY